MKTQKYPKTPKVPYSPKLPENHNITRNSTINDIRRGSNLKQYRIISYIEPRLKPLLLLSLDRIALISIHYHFNLLLMAFYLEQFFSVCYIERLKICVANLTFILSLPKEFICCSVNFGQIFYSTLSLSISQICFISLHFATCPINNASFKKK